MMSGNELQFGLIGLVVLVVAGVFVYNLWQERRARKLAEQAFRSNHHDVLLEEESEPSVPPPAGGRMEPGLRKSAPSAASAAKHSVLAKPVEPSCTDSAELIDCVVALEAPAGVSASALFASQFEVMSGFSRSMRWFGWDDASNQWSEIEANTPGSLTRASVALQLADRRGSISANELDRFYAQLQRVCDQFLAVPRLPQRAEVLEKAAEIDRFCADVDIVIAINLITQGAAFAGTKIRGLAEAAGMVLGADGAYQLRDETGHLLYALANLDPHPFTPEQLRHIQSHGLVLSLDVPRTLNPAQTFDRMITFAQHLAGRLEGSLVDDNRVPLSERSIGLIRNQIYQFELQMERQSIPAGSEVALRLFA